MKNSNSKLKSHDIEKNFKLIIHDFNTLLGQAYIPHPKTKDSCLSFIDAVFSCGGRYLGKRRDVLVSLINSKFEINKNRINDFYAVCAKNKVFFNYHEKLQVKQAYDGRDFDLLKDVLGPFKKVLACSIDEFLRIHFHPVDINGSFERLESELKSPTLTRKDSKPKDRSSEILEALFCGYVFHSFEIEYSHRAISDQGKHYQETYWQYLHSTRAHLFSRNNALCIVHLKQSQANSYNSYCEMRTNVFDIISSVYAKLNNHGFFVFILDDMVIHGKNIRWELCEDIVLFSEHFLDLHIHNNFFDYNKIAAITEKYIPTIDCEKASFSKASFGFLYKDIFVVKSPRRLIVILQKNEANETIIPCPACRSETVQGNSYSSLGIRSWECKNVICPDKSKFNRGKRYSFYQLLMQEAILHDSNLISKNLVRRWSRDIVENANIQDIVEMAVRFYSLSGDTITFIDCDGGYISNRNVQHATLLEFKNNCKYSNWFKTSPFFNRFMCKEPIGDIHHSYDSVTCGKATIINGDSRFVLKDIPTNFFDGAVTSPPYYNAREYSQWDNIYCYLYDMKNIAIEVFRTLKPGAVYLYNIFNYFDNENNIAFSALGKRRLALSSYMAYIFREIGFLILDTIAWDKGEIEGKRAFNNGNYSPYYQAPFNCWEHILVVQKPGEAYYNINFPDVLNLKPVFKMVNGENRHGHSAPFPEGIPNILLKRLPHDCCVLDPFGGSMTTSIAGNKNKIRTMCIEKSKIYFELGLQYIRGNVQTKLID